MTLKMIVIEKKRENENDNYSVKMGNKHVLVFFIVILILNFNNNNNNEQLGCFVCCSILSIFFSKYKKLLDRNVFCCEIKKTLKINQQNEIHSKQGSMNADVWMRMEQPTNKKRRTKKQKIHS